MVGEFPEWDPLPDPIGDRRIAVERSGQQQLHAHVLLSGLRLVDVFVDRDRRQDFDVDAEFLPCLANGCVRG